jgi:hypothetical protein
MSYIQNEFALQYGYYQIPFDSKLANTHIPAKHNNQKEWILPNKRHQDERIQVISIVDLSFYVSLVYSTIVDNTAIAPVLRHVSTLNVIVFL